MLNIEQVLKQDRLLRALTGMNRKAIEALLPTFGEVYEHTRQELHEQPRQRAVGGGRKARLETYAAKLFFILFYFKCYPTFDVAGFIFGIHRSVAHDWVHRLQPVLEATLEKKMVLPERQINSIEAFLERYPTVKRVMIDGTERQIQRPKDSEKQKLNYSGKKKHHTRKHLAAVDEQKRVLILSKAREGKVHDKRAHDEDDMAGSIPEEIPIEVDSGFLGLQKQYENIHVPHRKPKGGELSETQKEANRLLSSSRVVCENAFAGVKRYFAVSQIYRNRIQDFDDKLMLTATGLWNWYLMAA
ncbi:MAG: transposase [Hydrococcus sp. RM1_1_31]|nr:transposase [Hydrococcus sp. RM1_1_31]